MKQNLRQDFKRSSIHPLHAQEEEIAGQPKKKRKLSDNFRLHVLRGALIGIEDVSMRDDDSALHMLYQLTSAYQKKLYYQTLAMQKCKKRQQSELGASIGLPMFMHRH